MANYKDLTGKRFGRLTVIKRIENNKHRKAQWLCRCDCGNDCVVVSSNLLSDNTKSCGCLNIDTIKNNNTKYKSKLNNYYIVGDIVYVQYNNSYDCFVIDIDDLSKIESICWIKNDKGYTISTKKFGDIRLHRMIMDCSDGMQVDHINRKKWDNRKCNLRIVTNQQNSINRSLRIDNKYNFCGIYKHGNKYQSSITYLGNTIYLGSFEDIEDAIEARKQAEIKYFGEYRSVTQYE